MCVCLCVKFVARSRSTLEKQEEKLKASEALGAAAKEAAAAATAAAFSAAQEELESVRQRAAKAERALEVLDSDHEELKMQLDASRGNRWGSPLLDTLAVPKHEA